MDIFECDQLRNCNRSLLVHVANQEIEIKELKLHVTNLQVTNNVVNIHTHVDASMLEICMENMLCPYCKANMQSIWKENPNAGKKSGTRTCKRCTKKFIVLKKYLPKIV